MWEKSLGKTEWQKNHMDSGLARFTKKLTCEKQKAMIWFFREMQEIFIYRRELICRRRGRAIGRWTLLGRGWLGWSASLRRPTAARVGSHWSDLWPRLAPTPGSSAPRSGQTSTVLHDKVKRNEIIRRFFDSDWSILMSVGHRKQNKTTEAHLSICLKKSHKLKLEELIFSRRTFFNPHQLTKIVLESSTKFYGVKLNHLA